MMGNSLERLFTAACSEHLKAMCRQTALQGTQDLNFVVNNQNTGSTFAHLSIPSAFPSALALDLFGFGVYPFPQGAPGAMSFHDPLEGTETTGNVKRKILPPPGRSSTQICPPCASTNPLLTANPSPEPGIVAALRGVPSTR